MDIHSTIQNLAERSGWSIAGRIDSMIEVALNDSFWGNLFLDLGDRGWLRTAALVGKCMGLVLESRQNYADLETDWVLLKRGKRIGRVTICYYDIFSE